MTEERIRNLHLYDQRLQGLEESFSGILPVRGTMAGSGTRALPCPNRIEFTIGNALLGTSICRGTLRPIGLVWMPSRDPQNRYEHFVP